MCTNECSPTNACIWKHLSSVHWDWEFGAINLDSYCKDREPNAFPVMPGLLAYNLRARMLQKYCQIRDSSEKYVKATYCLSLSRLEVWSFNHRELNWDAESNNTGCWCQAGWRPLQGPFGKSGPIRLPWNCTFTSKAACALGNSCCRCAWLWCSAELAGTRA